MGKPECDPRVMYGGMELVALLHERLSRRKAYLTQIEPLLLEHIMPELAAAEGYVRMQACSVLDRYGKVTRRVCSRCLGVCMFGPSSLTVCLAPAHAGLCDGSCRKTRGRAAGRRGSRQVRQCDRMTRHAKA